MKSSTLILIVLFALSVVSNAQYRFERPSATPRVSSRAAVGQTTTDFLIKAHRTHEGIRVEGYTTVSEKVDRVQLEQSTDRKVFVTIHTAENSFQHRDFHVVHHDTLAAPQISNHYRYRIIGSDGNVYFTKIVTVQPNRMTNWNNPQNCSL